MNDLAKKGLVALSMDDVRRLAPAALALQPHESRSPRYGYISSIKVIEAMLSHGFSVVAASQTAAKVAGRQNFKRHLLKFSHVDFLDGADSLPQVVMINAHDGSSSWHLHCGRFRFVCENGLIVADADYGSISVPHSGNVVDKVIEASFKIISESAAVEGKIEAWRSVLLPADAQVQFANKAIELRYPGRTEMPVKADFALVSRRPEDSGTDVWSIFNRIQENLVRGGHSYRAPSGRAVKARPINGISRSVTLNQGLWSLADETYANYAPAA